MGVAAMVLGIIGLLFALNPWMAIVGVILSVLALVLGVVGRKQAAQQQKPSGMATAGMIMGIIGVAIGAIIFAACAACVKGLSDVAKEAEKTSKHLQLSGPPAKIGETVTFSDSNWVVTKATSLGTQINGLDGRVTTEGRFLQVTFTITNLGKQNDTLLDLPVVVDPGGREWHPHSASSSNLAPGTKDLLGADLPPNLPRTFSEVYEVAPGATNLSFRARELAPMGKGQLVELDLNGGPPLPPRPWTAP